MQLPLPATLALQTAANAVLSLDERTRSRLRKLQGKVVEVHLLGLDLHLYVLIHADRLEVLNFFDGDVDAIIRGAPMAMASMGLSTRALFEGEVEIDGDIECGTQFKRLIESLDIDWEEHLSQFTGDIAAHQMGNAVRRTRTWLDRTVQAFGEDLGDYLREEALLTPTESECDAFQTDVDTLRSDVDRLAQRIERVHGKLNSP